jgi:hypothetical protein
MEARLAVLRARRDAFIGAAKALLLICVIAWLCGICFYDTAADPALDRPKILLPTRLTHALLLADIAPLEIRRIWGGPATLFGLQGFATCLLGLGLFALAWARLSHRPFSRKGAALALASLPLWMLSFQESGRIAYPTLVRAEQFGWLTRLVETRQPGAVARLRAGGRLGLPDDEGGKLRLRTRTDPGGTLSLTSASDEPPIRDRIDAEALRFALAQEAMFVGDRATLRRLLPIRLAMPPADQPARNDIAQRLAALGRAAGAPPVPPDQAAWVAAGEASWDRALALIRANRTLIQLTLVLGLVALLIGLVLGRHVRTIERLAAAAGPAPARSFGRRRRAAPGA